MSKQLKPQIRFKGFEDEWEITPISKSFSLISFKPYIATATDKGKHPVIQQGLNSVAGFSDKSPCKDFEDTVVLGDHTLSLYHPTTPFLVASDGIKILKSNFSNGKFFYHFLDKYKPETEGYKRHFTILIEKTGYSPGKIEQKKISEYLDLIDKLISETEREIGRLEKMKQASLQKMFPRPGTTTPEIRFAGFTEPWKLRSVGDMFSEGTSRGRYDNLLSVSINDGVYPTTDFIKTHTVKSFSNYKNVHKHDIVYNSMRMWQGASGVSFWDGIVSPAYTVLCPKEDVYSPFMGYYFKLSWVIKIFELNSQGLTRDTWNIKYPAISLLKFYVPNNIKEQTAIAKYFNNLDSVISSKRQKLAKLRQIKQACLDKMFVNATEL